MRGGRFGKQFMVIICVGAAPAMLWAQEDANGPWDPAEQFEPYWESVKFTAQLTNRAEQSFTGPDTRRSLTVYGAVRQLDKTGLIGVDTSPRKKVVLDQDGVEIYRAGRNPYSSRSYRGIDDFRNSVGRGRWNDDIQFYVNMPMDPNRDYPTSLSRVECTLAFLVADTFEVVEVPFAPNPTWVELTPGLEILVEEASVEEDEYSYRIRAIYDPELVAYSAENRWHLWANETLPPVLVAKMELLDIVGKPVDRVSLSGQFSGGTSRQGCDDLMIATSTGSGSCGMCGYVKTIRFALAFDPCEQRVPFVLENVPIPSF